MLEPNFDLAREAYLTVNNRTFEDVNKRRRVKEAPVIIWKDSYEKNPAEFYDLIQDISNCLLLNGPSLYDAKNPNHSKLFNVAEGIIDSSDYKMAEYAYGEKGAAPIRNNNFFYAAKNQTVAQIIEQGLQFTCRNIDNQYSDKKIYENEKLARKLIKNLFAEKMEQDEGMDLGFIKDKSISLQGKTKKEIIDNLFGQEQLELVIWKMLQNMNYVHNIEDLATQCFDNKLDVNAQFAMIDVVDGEVIPKHVHPDMVRWIATQPITTLEDKSVSAVSVIDHLGFNQIINEYSTMMDTGTGVRGLVDTIERLKSNRRMDYDPTKPYFSEYGKMNSLTTNINDQDDDKYNSWGKVDYMKSIFYPYQKSPYGMGISVLRHKMFFKVQRERRFIVEIDGKKATDALYEKWKKTDFQNSLRASFTELGTDEPTPKDSYIIKKFRDEVWQATQLGHNVLLDVKRYKYGTKNRNGQSYIGLPIVGQISRKKSFVLVGESISQWVNILYMRIEEILNLAGLSNILAVDESIISEKDAKSVLYNAKKTGILMYNSSRMTGGNPMTGQHMSVLKIGHHLEEINNMLAMIGMFTNIYKTMVGSSDQSMGISEPYDGLRETQMNVQNQSQLKTMNFHEHAKFMNQVLQRAADIGKYEWAIDDRRNITLMSGERQLLKLTKDLALGDYDIFIDAGWNTRAKKQLIDNAIIQALSSGGIEMMEPLIAVLASDNPVQALAIFRETKDMIIKTQTAQQQAAQQQAQAELQMAQQKNNVPIEVAKIKAEADVQTTQMKIGDKREAENFKGQLSDVNENNERDKMILKAGLDGELQSLQQNQEQEFPA